MEALTWVDIKNSFSFIEVKNEMKEQLMNGLNGQTYRGRPVKIENRGNREDGVPRERNRGYSSDRRGSGGDKRFEKGWGSSSGDRGGDRRSSGGGDRRGGGGFDRRSSGGGGERRSSGGFDRRSSGGDREFKPRERSSGSDYKPRERSGGGTDFKPRERNSGSDYKPRERKTGGAFERKVGGGGPPKSDGFKKTERPDKPNTPPTRPASGMNRAERRKAKFGTGGEAPPKGDS